SSLWLAGHRLGDLLHVRQTSQHTRQGAPRRNQHAWHLSGGDAGGWSQGMSVVATPHEGPSTGEPAPALQHRLGPLRPPLRVAGTMIGSGIFIVSADIARDVGSSGWLLAVWALTGVMTVIGALSYAELAAMMPYAGGQYVYLREAFNPLCGFLYGWTLFLVIQTGTIAAVAVAFAKFSGVWIPALRADAARGAWILAGPVDLGVWWPDSSGESGTGWVFTPIIKGWTITSGHLLAVGVVWVLTLINCRGVREGKWVQNVFTVGKVLLLLALI